MWGLINHYHSKRLKKSVRPKTPINNLSPLKPFVRNKKIATPMENTPTKIQRFNGFSFDNFVHSQLVVSCP